MIKGLYEAHLPVSNINNSIEFYRGLGLDLAIKYEKTAFFGSLRTKAGWDYGNVTKQK